MTQINNKILIKYNKGMSKSILDKIFFIDKIADKDYINTLVDFGCADGELINKVNALSDNFTTFYGYDTSPSMIEIASKQCNCGKFSSEWESILKEIDTEHSILNISSVIHEIYTYCDSIEINDFWDKVFNSNFKYISIRDFMISQENCDKVNLDDMRKIMTSINQGTNSLIDKWILNSFINKWGDLTKNENLLHYLMKYRFASNWKRENEENYFALKLEDFIQVIPIDKYEILWYNEYTLPFTKQKIKTDFGIDLKDNTRMKIILRKRD